MEILHIQNTLKNILLEMGIPQKSITLDADFNYDLGLDSLSMTELIMDIERKFEISISDEDYEKIKNFAGAVSYIKEKNNLLTS